MRIGLVACVKAKRAQAAPARDLYTSALFRKAAAYCQATYSQWGILSAKHGLVLPDDVIAPYDATLVGQDATARYQWALRVMGQLEVRYGREGLAASTFFLHAGRAYRDQLAPMLRVWAKGVEMPLAGLGIGQQLAWYVERGY